MRSTLLLAALVLLPTISRADEYERFFETKIRPILTEHCVGCHGPKK